MVADGRALVELELIDLLVDLSNPGEHLLVNERNNPLSTDLQDLFDEAKPRLAAKHRLVNRAELGKEVEQAGLAIHSQTISGIDIVEPIPGELAEQFAASHSHRRRYLQNVAQRLERARQVNPLVERCGPFLRNAKDGRPATDGLAIRQGEHADIPQSVSLRGDLAQNRALLGESR